MGSRRSSLQTLAVKGSTNAGLWLNKFIRDQKTDGQETATKTDGQETTAKQNLVQEVSEIPVPPIYESFYKDIWLKSLLTSSEIRFIKIEGRMIIGLGADSVLETSITLHRTYGVPYIPGSALKGLAASYAHRFMGEDWRKETKTNVIGKAHEIIFGSQNSAGFVNFIDALYVPDSYVRKPKRPLEPDILTVHHSKYYQGEANSAPADWDSPVPIPLLSAQGKYLLAISADSGDKEFDKKLESLAIDILEYALRDEGIGAKTSSGYGRASLEYLPLTQEEKEQQQIERQENKLHGVAERLEAIGNYDKESKDRFKVLAKELRKLTPPLKKEGATLLIERVRIVSQLDDDVLENAEWFVEVKKMAQD